MKLSEAIRLGSMMHKQVVGAYFTFMGDHLNGSCALGAATVGYTGATKATWSNGVDVTLRSIMDNGDRLLECPVCMRMYMAGFLSVISHLNDGHGWTRERIAAWVESVGDVELGEVKKDGPGSTPTRTPAHAEVTACVAAHAA